MSKREERREERSLKEELDAQVSDFDIQYKIFCELAKQDKVAAYRIGSKIITDLDGTATQYLGVFIKNVNGFEKLYTDWTFDDEGYKSFYEYISAKKPLIKKDLKDIFDKLTTSGMIGLGVAVLIAIFTGANLGASLGVGVPSFILAVCGLTGSTMIEKNYNIKEIKLHVWNIGINKKIDTINKVEDLMNFLMEKMSGIENELKEALEEDVISEEEQSEITKQLKEIEEIKKELRETLTYSYNPKFFKEEGENE